MADESRTRSNVLLDKDPDPWSSSGMAYAHLPKRTFGEPRERVMRICGDCNGSGIDDGFGDDCAKCDGSGMVPTALTKPIGETADGPTDKQISFAVSLFGQLGTDEGMAREALAKMTKRQASTAIDSMLKQIALVKASARKTSAAATTQAPSGNGGGSGANVPEGRYAIENVDGALRFYQIDRPTEGKWAGYVFVNVLASDERHPVRNRAERDRILSVIGQNPQAASIRYGREIGACGRCGRTLTDEASRAAGIGPICAAKAW